MKLGFITAILGDYTFEQVVDFASEHGFQCLEVACWPSGKAERRYAGVSHIDVENLDDAKVKYIKDYCSKKHVEISSLAFYPNPLDGNVEKHTAAIEHLKKLIAASKKLGVNLVTTFIGRDQFLTIEDNLKLFKEVWTPIVKFAEDSGVKIGIENCPMLFSNDQWPGGQNLATSPAIWRKMFELIPSKYLGINFDPSHFVWQMMDYIKPIYEFKDRFFHIHIKDIKLFQDKLNDNGIMATPLQFMAPKIPGLGDVNWSKFISALTDIGYTGFACLEIEDRSFENTLQDRLNALILSKRYIDQFVI